jgi:hypothetical protein
MPETEATPTEDSAFAQHPEVFVGVALLGGIVLAQVLKRLGADD